MVVGSDIKTEQEYGDYADIIVNLCNSHYMRGCIENRYDFYRRLAFMTGKTVVYVNNVGGQTDVIYDGSSAVFNSRGEALALLKSFEEDFQVIDLNADVPPCKIPEQNKTINVYRAIKLGLGDFSEKRLSLGLHRTVGRDRLRGCGRPGCRSIGAGECTRPADAFAVLFRPFGR